MGVRACGVGVRGGRGAWGGDGRTPALTDHDSHAIMACGSLVKLMAIEWSRCLGIDNVLLRCNYFSVL